MTSSAIAELPAPTAVGSGERLCEKSVIFEQLLLRYVCYKHEASLGLDRTQTLLLPERLEDYVAAENPVRFLDAFVASLDLHALGFARTQGATTGRPPYDPGALLKLYLYGYLHRIRSPRLLEAECQSRRAGWK